MVGAERGKSMKLKEIYLGGKTERRLDEVLEAYNSKHEPISYQKMCEILLENAIYNEYQKIKGMN